MKNLMTKDPHYIRCIKPNVSKQKKVFEPELVLHQVRYLGLMENVRVRRAGYAFRMEFGRFLQRYKMLSKRTWPNFKGGGPTGARLVSISCCRLSLDNDSNTPGRSVIVLKAPLTSSFAWPYLV
jgi:myosin-1